MSTNILAIAGGSGSGKSTLAYKLEDAHPDQVSILHLDDYQTENESNVPMYKGFRNWDDPACIEFDRLSRDLAALKKGNPVTLRTWASRKNPDYRTTRQRKEINIPPHPTIIVEGYLVLYHPDIRSLCSITIYLDTPEAIRLSRRDKGIFTDTEVGNYNELVTKPMHEQYVEPTKQYADHIYDTSRINKEQLAKCINELILKS